MPALGAAVQPTEPGTASVNSPPTAVWTSDAGLGSAAWSAGIPLRIVT